MKRLLILSSVRWDFLWQRHQALALAAAEAGWTVDFLEPPLRGFPHAASAVRQRLRGGAPAGVSNETPPQVNVVRPVPHFPFLSQRAQQRHLDQLLEPSYDGCLLYLPTSPLVTFAERVTNALIYDSVVDWSTAPKNWWPPSDYVEAEERMLEPRWSWMTDSHVVAARQVARRGQCLLLPPAADREFAEADWSDPSSHEAVLYFGTVRAQETDIQLLCDLATAGTRVRVVGPIDDDASLEALTSSGVRCDPPVLPTALPTIVNQSSALILPYRSARSETLVPAKLWNCLATNRVLFVRGLNLPASVASDFHALPLGNQAAVQEIQTAQLAPIPRPGRVETWQGRWRQVESLLSAGSGLG